jgi:hypothetical protein
MALMGISTSVEGGDFLDRVQYDAKAGKWHRVTRSQDASGAWISDMFEMDKGDMFIMDLPTIEVGWILFASTGPDFQMVANGQPVPPRPSENHKAGFRMKVLLPKEEAPRTFASTAKSVVSVIDELHTKAASGPAGQVPVVKIAGTRVVETKGKAGTSRNYAPLLEIVKYVPRPAPLGDAPSMGVTMAPSAPPAPAPQPAPAPAPARVLVDDEVPF